MLKAGKEVTVWASGSGHSHSPPNHLVFKSTKSWGTGEKIDTSLVDASDEVSAHIKKMTENSCFEVFGYKLQQKYVHSHHVLFQSSNHNIIPVFCHSIFFTT